MGPGPIPCGGGTPLPTATKKPKEKGRAVQLVVKINEFRYRLALFRSSCVTTAIVSGTADSYISSTPLYNKTLFDLRNKIRLLGFAHPASYICRKQESSSKLLSLCSQCRGNIALSALLLPDGGLWGCCSSSVGFSLFKCSLELESRLPALQPRLCRALQSSLTSQCIPKAEFSPGPHAALRAGCAARAPQLTAHRSAGSCRVGMRICCSVVLGWRQQSRQREGKSPPHRGPTASQSDRAAPPVHPAHGPASPLAAFSSQFG